MRTRLNERDLNRIVRRVINEGVVTETTFTGSGGANDGDSFVLSCSKAISGTLDPAKQYTNNPYIKKGEQIIPLSNELIQFFCKS
jgi:hypothetical protein